MPIAIDAHRALTMAWLAVTIGCRGSELAVEVSPAASGQGEPLRVVVTASAPPGTEIAIEVSDPTGTVITRSSALLDVTGHGEAWVVPAPSPWQGTLAVRASILRLGSVTRRVPLDPGRPVLRPVFHRGLHDEETDDRGGFRWTTARAEARLVNFEATGVALVIYACGRPDQSITLVIDGSHPTLLPCGDTEQRSIRLPLSRAFASQSHETALSIWVDPPLRRELTHDPRELGLRLYDFVLTRGRGL